MRIANLALLVVLTGCDRSSAPGSTRMPAGSAGAAASTPTLPTAPSPAPSRSWTDTRLATSTATGALPPGALEVVVTRNELRFGADGRVLARLPAEPDRVGGFGAEYKPSPRDLKVLPLVDAAKQAMAEASPPARALVVVDAATPYRIFTEVLYSLGQSNVGFFELAVRNGESVATISTVAPSPGRPTDPIVQRLNLTVIVVREGLSVKASGGNLAPGCTTVAAGLTLPRSDAGYDLIGLRACVARIKSSDARYANETEVVVAANPDVDFQTVVGVLDALRVRDDGNALFPDVRFGLAR